MRLRLQYTLLTALFIIGSASLGIAATFSGQLVKVIDGDTVEVLRSNRAERIRLHGIDTPERGQAYGRKAKQFVLDIAVQKVVVVKVRDKDRYGRTVGEVILPDGTNLNRELVKRGYAWWYRQYSDDASLGNLEAEARKARLGLWQDPDPVAPWEWRHASRQRIKTPSENLRQEATSPGGYHGNVKSRVFHQPSCRYFDCKNCIRSFKDRREALREGFTPCGICNP